MKLKKKNSLVIGNTSQLSYFFPDDYIKISSRYVDFDYLRSNNWESVYITFAEQRVHSNNIDYLTPNCLYTRDIISSLVDSSNKIVIYTTCDLWNNYTGSVSIDDEPNFSYNNDYCLSKRILMNWIINFRKIGLWNNVIIIHPFNFNSTYRKKEFLFGNIFDSIINKKKIEIGNTYFYRDMVHTKYMVERSIKAKNDEMVGSGRLFFVNDFIRDLYKYFDMKYEDYVKENIVHKSNHSEKLFYSSQTNIYTYDMLLNDTINDIKERL
jgi:GDP-D-mannose dehydratase